MAAMPSGGAVGTAARLSPRSSWETDWDEDEEDQADQHQKISNMKRSVTPPATTPVAPPHEVPDCWDDADPETLVENLKPKSKPKPEEKLAANPLTGRPAETLAAKPLLDREVIAPAVKVKAAAVKVKPAIEQRYWGRVGWFRGCSGWVTSDNVRTDRVVNPQKSCCRNANSCYGLTTIANAIYLHRNDCQGFVARCGMDVNFRIEPDIHGKLKCADVRQECQEDRQECPEGQRMTLGSYREEKKRKEQVADSKSRSKARMQATSKPPQTTAIQSKFSHSNLALHHRESGSCSSSTAAGLTSCSASVADVTSELDVQSQASVLDMKNKWTDRQKETSSVEIATHYVVEIEPTEEFALDQHPVPDCWEDEVPDCWEDEVFEEIVHVDTKEANLQVGELSDETQRHETPVTCPKPKRRTLVNRKLAKPKAAPQEGQLAQFCRAMGPQFPFEFVARHLGADFDAIVQSASDVHSLDSLVQAGMKPLHRNKFCRALREEKEQRATRGESPKHDFADFLAKIGPEFDHSFLAHNLGTDNLDEIIMRFTDLDDFNILVVAGMKPLLKNKLYRQLALERKARH